MNQRSRVLAVAKITTGKHNWLKFTDQMIVGCMILTDARTTQLLHPKLEEYGWKRMERLSELEDLEICSEIVSPRDDRETVPIIPHA